MGQEVFMGKKIEKEAERLEKETGIDFKKYRSPETVEKISDLISFYQQTTTFVLKYTAIFLIIIGALCYWFHTRGMSVVGIVLFLLAGIVFSLLGGPSLGLIKLTKKAVSDGMDVVVMMLDFVKEVRQDVIVLSKKKPGAKISSANLVRGVSYIVFIPAVRQIVQAKLKLLAIPVNFFIGNSIFYLTKSLTAVMDKADSKDPGKQAVQAKSPGEQEGPGESVDKFDQLVDEAKKSVGPLADSVARKVAVPAKILFTVTLFIGVPILLIIYLIFK
jgi:hypothetical protein